MMALGHNQHTAAVLVVGNSVVGQVLELLLASADLSVRFESNPSPDEPWLLDGVRLVLIAQGTDPELRRGVLKLIRDKPRAERIPILELTTNYREKHEDEKESQFLLPWPCRIEDLKRRIQDILFAGELESQDLGKQQTWRSELAVSGETPSANTGGRSGSA